MKGTPRRFSYPRTALLAVALLLPTASLVPLGGIWLWQHGYVPHWAIATCTIVALTYYLLAKLVAKAPAAAVGTGSDADEEGETAWTTQQVAAWEDVKALASSATPERMMSRDAVLSLGLETVEAVARRLHPERKDPLLQFTAPEALAVVERASDGLRRFILSSFPLGDRVTVAQVMWLYRWRGALPLIEKGYDLWRVVRLLNPISAATQELRERFTRQLYDMGRDHLGRRLARAYVREVGRAAIDLYGGSLRVTSRDLDRHVTSQSRRDLAAAEARDSEPIRILVAGQSGAGKSSLVNALANAVEAEVSALPATARVTAYRLIHDGLPAALVIDTPGVTEAFPIEALVESTADADMILWVASATRAAREIDRRALSAIRAHTLPDRHVRRPPMLLVLTHIDGLRPFAEWNPPYDLTSEAPKAKSIAGAMQAAGEELGFGPGEIVPVRLDIAVAPYNVDVLWSKIIALVPDAQRARLLRTLSDISSASGWATIWSQAVNAGKVIKGTFFDRSSAL